MSYLPLVHNLAMLVSLSVLHALLTQRLRRDDWLYLVFSGSLFGGVAILGMLTPLVWAPGIFFDGRSIVLGVAGLFGGPAVAAIATVLAASFRVAVGGSGVAAALAVMAASSLLGLLARSCRKRRPWLGSPAGLLAIGLVVHACMICLLGMLPGGMTWTLLLRIGVPVLLAYPVVFMLVALVFIELETRAASEAALRSSEHKYARIFQMSPDAIDLTELRSGVMLECNPSFEKLYGYRRQEILGRSTLPSDLGLWVNHEDRDRHIADLETHGVALGFEAQLRRKDGTTFIGLVSSSLLEIHGRLCNMTLARDITEQKRYAEALRVSEEKFRNIFEWAPVGIFQSTREGRLAYANPEYIRMMGYDSFEDLTKAIEEVGGIADLLWVEPELRGQWVAKAAAERGWQRMVNQYRRKDGQVFPGNLIFTLMPDARGQNTLLVGYIEDITEHRRAEEALKVLEERFSKIFYLSPDAITINRLDDGRYIDVNQSFTDMLGYAREEVVGRSSLPDGVSVWIDKADRERMVARLKTYGEAIRFEARFRCKNGDIIQVLESSKLLEIGGEPCVLAITRDVTESLRAEAMLRENAQRLQLAVAAGNFGIWDLDLMGGSLVWNERMYEIYGVDRMAALPSHIQWIDQFIHPEDRPAVQAAMGSSIEKRVPCDVEFRILRADGALRHISANAMVIRDDQGQAARMIGVSRDITDQVEAESERRRLRVELQHVEKLESIGSLAGGVAHDMNNVLAAILVSAELLRGRQADGDPAVKLLDAILHAGQRGRDLVKALTDFARKDLEERHPFDLNEVVRKEVDLLRRTTLQKIRFDLVLGGDLPKTLGDASAVGSAIMNLSVNALDAMPDGGTLTIATRKLEGDLVELSIADTGCGMTPDVKAKAMEPFFTTKPAGKGTGLGLARVYGIAKAHGGTLDLSSEPGRGTTVVLRLPGVTGRSADPIEAARMHEEGAERPIRVLLVDDDPIIRDTIPDMVRSLGLHAETVPSGEEALRLLAQDSGIDLVILDHNMPGMTGAETLKALRGLQPDLPVIFATGFPGCRHGGVPDPVPASQHPQEAVRHAGVPEDPGLLVSAGRCAELITAGSLKPPDPFPGLPTWLPKRDSHLQETW